MPIAFAAIKYDGKIYTGKRHAEIMQDIIRDRAGDEDVDVRVKITQDMQGFVDTDGNFLNRWQSGAVAFMAGQTKTRKLHLLSEDLW